MTNACKYTVKGYIRLDVSIVQGKYLPRVDETPGGARSGRGTTGGTVYRGSSAEPLGGDAPLAGKLTEQEEADGATSPPAFRPMGWHTSLPKNVSWDDAAFLCFSVSDTGIGVADDKKDLLFKAFTQVQARQSDGE